MDKTKQLAIAARSRDIENAQTAREILVSIDDLKDPAAREACHKIFAGYLIDQIEDLGDG